MFFYEIVTGNTSSFVFYVFHKLNIHLYAYSTTFIYHFEFAFKINYKSSENALTTD